MAVTAEYKKGSGGGEVIPAEEIKRRLDQGDEFNKVYDQAYNAFMKSSHDEPKARKYANSVLLKYGQEFFQSSEGVTFSLDENESRERLYSLVYDRRRIAQKMGEHSGFDQHIITHMPWAALQTLATNLISRKTLEELMTLFEHYLTRENCTHPDSALCPNSLRPDNKTVRFYCYKPTQENMKHIHMLYLSLKEELGEMSNDEFMELQTLREAVIEAKFTSRIEEEPIEEEEAQEEGIAQEPAIQELQQVLPAKPEPIVPPTVHTTGFTEQATGFSAILTIKNTLIAELEKQVVALAGRVAELEEERESIQVEHKSAEESFWSMLEEAQDKVKVAEEKYAQIQAEFEKFKLETNTFHLAKNNAQRSLHRATAQLNDALKSVKEALTSVIND